MNDFRLQLGYQYPYNIIARKRKLNYFYKSKIIEEFFSISSILFHEKIKIPLHLYIKNGLLIFEIIYQK